MYNNAIPIHGNRGFTIVELLVVIIVIAILATIMIVSYNGITNRANATSGKVNATAIVKTAEAYNADTSATGGYPTSSSVIASYNGTIKIPGGVSLIATALSSAHKDGKTIQYLPKSGNSGACIAYWDGSLATPAPVYIYAGNATSGSNSSLTCS